MVSQGLEQSNGHSSGSNSVKNNTELISQSDDGTKLMLPCMVINYPSLGLARLHFISYILIKKKDCTLSKANFTFEQNFNIMVIKIWPHIHTEKLLSISLDLEHQESL